MSRIKGITVVLIGRLKVGEDPTGRPVYKDDPQSVENVLIAPISAADAIEKLNLTGKNVSYQLAIPKGDEHTWTGAKVEFFGKVWDVVGEPLEGLEHLIPLEWNKKVQVARHE